jgi:uncharacterized protein YijF (DUF1287 family)
MNATVGRGWIRLSLLTLVFCLNGLLSGQVNPAPAGDVAIKRAALSNAAMNEVGVTTLYDPAYVKLGYPGGDVPIERGVCTDVIIRALRKENVDLQVLVHEDKARAPQAYPRRGDKDVLDANIDHRRVANLMIFFARSSRGVPVTAAGADYLPGDIVVWRLPFGPLHIGLVTSRLAPGTTRPLVVHNIGEGAQCEDVLFTYKLVGHYRWFM